jgi:predicted amidohydrolase
MLRAGFFQFRPVFGKIKHNVAKVVNALKNTHGALIVLPELPFTGYYFQSRDELQMMAEEVANSSTIASLIALCRENSLHIVTGFAEKEQDRLFNSALLIGPQGVIHTYRKLHLFDKEKIWFDPGDIPLQIQTVLGIKIGMMVCFDWIYPEVTRVLTIQGANIICHPSNLVLDYCQGAMVSRCIENNIFAITANRFGADKRPHGEVRFTGKSQIVAPKGKLIHRAPVQKEQLFITEINVALAREKKITEINDIIADRRPDFYGQICKKI